MVAKCSPWTLVSDNVRIMRIFACVFLERVVKRRWDGRKQHFSVFSVAIASDCLKLRLKLLYANIQSLIGFPVTEK